MIDERPLHKMKVVKITFYEVDAEDYSDAVDRVSDGMGNIIDIDYMSSSYYSNMRTAYNEIVDD